MKFQVDTCLGFPNSQKHKRNPSTQCGTFAHNPMTEHLIKWPKIKKKGSGVGIRP